MISACFWWSLVTFRVIYNFIKPIFINGANNKVKNAEKSNFSLKKWKFQTWLAPFLSESLCVTFNNYYRFLQTFRFLYIFFGTLKLKWKRIWCVFNAFYGSNENAQKLHFSWIFQFYDILKKKRDFMCNFFWS